ncbi:MAG: NUDIX hydrolase [Actinomycetota bacterium]|nr:NUDIX hydrolase [Actinomycetota bacterium]
MAKGDGDGWVECAQGHQHWGLFGAAGLLLRYTDPAGAREVLLQHRVGWSHHGGTWGVPGGARDSGETAVEAAMREAIEETSLDAGRVRVTGSYRDDHGGWDYITVLAETDSRLGTVSTSESEEIRWVPEGDVTDLPLHPGFAQSWPLLQQ